MNVLEYSYSNYDQTIGKYLDAWWGMVGSTLWCAIQLILIYIILNILYKRVKNKIGTKKSKFIFLTMSIIATLTIIIEEIFT